MQVVEPDDLLDAARAEARRYLVGSPLAIRRTKQLVYEGLDRSMQEHLKANVEVMAACFASDDHREGVASFLEILQNCVVFNDAVFDHITGKEVAADAQILVEHGKPLLFGKNKEKALRLKPGTLELQIVTAGPDALVHDETNRPLAQLLAGLEPPFPAAMGVLYCNPAAPYEQEVYAQSGSATGNGELDALLNSERTWEVT